MERRILITGGAGFIGSHLADELVAHGYTVRCLDILSPQVHGLERRRPGYLREGVELQVADVTDPTAVRAALEGIESVYHFAAAVGVGQSMYAMADYTRTNALGTAVLLDAMRERPVRRLIVASSMSIYGEGRYRDGAGRVYDGVSRRLEDLQRHAFEPRLPLDGAALEPVPTPEDKPPFLSSVYALNKFDQEQMTLLAGRAYDVETVALRFFNVYGPRQALSNPYTGVLAIFASRLLNGRPPLVFEDGEQRRDFVHVRDVARACRLALESPEAVGEAINIGSGRSVTVRQIAEQVAGVLGKDIAPEITGRYRMGDIRHCFADVRKAKELLGFAAAVPLERGIEELSEWLSDQAPEDRTDEAQGELEARGLTL